MFQKTYIHNDTTISCAGPAHPPYPRVSRYTAAAPLARHSAHRAHTGRERKRCVCRGGGVCCVADVFCLVSAQINIMNITLGVSSLGSVSCIDYLRCSYKQSQYGELSNDVSVQNIAKSGSYRDVSETKVYSVDCSLSSCMTFLSCDHI